jgi:hypothetical protein
VHLLRNSFTYVPRQHWGRLKEDLAPIYQAVNVTAAEAALEQLEQNWGDRYPTLIRLWRGAWEEFIPFLDYPTNIRTVLCSTNAIESLNARYRRAIKARGHFPTEAAALKCLYQVTRSLDPTGRGQQPGPSAGNPHSTPSRSPSRTASSASTETRDNAGYTEFRTDPSLTKRAQAKRLANPHGSHHRHVRAVFARRAVGAVIGICW